MDLGAVLSFRHAVPDPQHLHCGVVTGVHQVEEIGYKLFAQEDSQLPGKALVVPQNHIQDHEEAINGACVFQADCDVQWGAGYGLPSCPDGVDATPREDRPPEGAILLIIVADGGTNFFKQSLRPKQICACELTEDWTDVF